MKLTTRAKLTFSILTCWIAVAVFLTGCAYSVIPTASINEAKDASDVLAEEGTHAEQRAAGYTDNPQARAEAARFGQAGRYATQHIKTPLGASKDASDLPTLVPEVAKDWIPAPWGAIIGTVTALATAGLGGLKVKQVVQAPGLAYADAVKRVTFHPSYGTVGEPPDMADPKDAEAVRNAMPSQYRGHFDKKHPATVV